MGVFKEHEAPAHETRPSEALGREFDGFPSSGGLWFIIVPGLSSSGRTADSMIIHFHIRGFNVNAASRRWFEQSLEKLQDLVPVSAAAVVLEYERESAPAFRASALLAVAGPDLHAEARDHTLEAAWLKVTAALRKQMEQRKIRQHARSKRNGWLRTPSIRSTASVASLRV
jgi:ribosome hibernation promoting factor